MKTEYSRVMTFPLIFSQRVVQLMAASCDYLQKLIIKREYEWITESNCMPLLAIRLWSTAPIVK